MLSEICCLPNIILIVIAEAARKEAYNVLAIASDLKYVHNRHPALLYKMIPGSCIDNDDVISLVN